MSLGPFAQPLSTDETDASRLLREVLNVMRVHLGMEVAFISRVLEGRLVLEYVDADPSFQPISVGNSQLLDETYCARVLDGRLPGLILDAGTVPEFAHLDVTREWSIGSHLSVPVHTEDGTTFGTLCCFSREVRPDLGEDDLRMVQMFAELVSSHAGPLVAQQHSKLMAQQRISTMLDEGRLRMALQPVVDLRTNEVEGYEALARFPDNPGWTPDKWFEAADSVRMGSALETAAVHSALGLLSRIPAHCSLAINVSAAALVTSPSILKLFCLPESHRLVLELIEHQMIAHSASLDEALARVRAAGVRVAVGDAGSGYAGLERILSLHPEVLKLDRTLVDGVAQHPARQAMVEAMVHFTQRTGASLVAEGVETQEDLDMLRELGVSHAQGFFLGRPTIWSREGALPP